MKLGINGDKSSIDINDRFYHVAKHVGRHLLKLIECYAAGYYLHKKSNCP